MTPELHRKIRNTNPRGFVSPSIERLLFLQAERLMELDHARGWSEDDVALVLASPEGELVEVTDQLIMSRNLEVPSRSIPVGVKPDPKLHQWIGDPPSDQQPLVLFVDAAKLDDSAACAARGREAFRFDAGGYVGNHGDPVLRSSEARLRVVLEVVTAREVGGPVKYRTQTTGLWLPRMALKCQACGRPY
jgi:hypothetical protein